MSKREQVFHQFLRPLKGIGLPINYDIPDLPSYESEFAYDKSKDKFMFSIEMNAGQEDFKWVTISRAQTVEHVTSLEYYIDSDDYVILAEPSEDEIVVYLPDAGDAKENEYHIKRVSNSNASSYQDDVVTVKSINEQTIDGVSEITISLANESIKVISNGNNWFII